MALLPNDGPGSSLVRNVHVDGRVGLRPRFRIHPEGDDLPSVHPFPDLMYEEPQGGGVEAQTRRCERAQRHMYLAALRRADVQDKLALSGTGRQGEKGRRCGGCE